MGRVAAVRSFSVCCSGGDDAFDDEAPHHAKAAAADEDGEDDGPQRAMWQNAGHGDQTKDDEQAAKANEWTLPALFGVGEENSGGAPGERFEHDDQAGAQWGEVV